MQLQLHGIAQRHACRVIRGVWNGNERQGAGMHCPNLGDVHSGGVE
jgi:hypothetical protein